jgi:hypothetical protein
MNKNFFVTTGDRKLFAKCHFYYAKKKSRYLPLPLPKNE